MGKLKAESHVKMARWNCGGMTLCAGRHWMHACHGLQMFRGGSEQAGLRAALFQVSPTSCDKTVPAMLG
jgi:hypothetical protein